MRLPASTLSIAFLASAASAQTSVTLPLEPVHQLTYINCSIANSGPLHCLVDTGSSMTGISRDLATRLKLKTHADSSGTRAGLLDDLTIHAGSASWTATRVSIAPGSLARLDLESGGSFHTDVILGTSLLGHFQLTIDPDAHQLRLAPSGTPVPTDAIKLQTSMQEIPFTILQLRAADGRALPAPFALDTGARPAMLLSRSFWASQPPLGVNDPEEANSQILTLDAIRLGSFTLSSVPAIQPAHGSGLIASSSVGGIIGARLLNRFVVIYDLPRNEVWIKPASTLHDPF